MNGDAGLWCCHTDDDGPQHHWPVGDIIEHEVDVNDDRCACGPITRGEKRADGTIGWVIVHHSLDGREIDE